MLTITTNDFIPYQPRRALEKLEPFKDKQYIVKVKTGTAENPRCLTRKTAVLFQITETGNKQIGTNFKEY